MIPRLPSYPVMFPDPNHALKEPGLDGLLAVGGALTPEWMLTAYANAIFPWFSENDKDILWWSPSERASLKPENLEVSKSFSKVLRNKPYKVTLDHDFNGMVQRCAQTPRKGQPGTWIVPSMRQAYDRLHRLGFAHCVEVWMDNEIVGGLFGVQINGVFIGESMVSLKPEASKIALAHLCLAHKELGIDWIDCQLMTNHLSSMGAHAISRQDYRTELKNRIQKIDTPKSWAGLLEGFNVHEALEKFKTKEFENESQTVSLLNKDSDSVVEEQKMEAEAKKRKPS